MNSTLFQSVSLGTIALAFILGVIFVFKTYVTHKESIVQAIKVIPEILSVIKNFMAEEGKSTETIDKLMTIVNVSVDAVEQIATKKEIHGQDKQDLAIEYFRVIAKNLGIEVSDLDDQTVKILIEQAVKAMNQKEQQKLN